MSVDLNSLNTADLTDANLGDFLSAIEAALAANEYKKVKEAIKQIYAIALVPNSTIIGVDKDGNGNVSMNVGETANITKIAKEIYEKVQKDVDDSSKSPSKDRDDLVDEMNKYLTGIFNQQNLTKELIDRGFSIDDFSKSIDSANKASESRINDIKREKEGKKRFFEGVFGKDELISTGNFTKKSVPTKVEDIDNAISYLGFAESVLKQLQKARADKASADPSKQDMYDKFIKDLEGRLKFTTERIKSLNIPGFDKDVLDKWGDEAEIGKTLAKGGALEKFKNTTKASKDKIYDDLRIKLSALTADDQTKLGLIDESGNKTAFGKAVDELSSSDPTIVDTARITVGNHIKAGADMSEYDKAINRERELIQLRNKNIEQYKQMYVQIEAKKNKLKVKTVKKEKEVYILDESGNKIQAMDNAGKPITDGSGNPVYQTTKYIQVIDANTGKPVYEDVTENGVTKRVPKLETEVINGQTQLKINYEEVEVTKDVVKEVYLLDESGNKIQAKDNNGNPMVDNNGDPVYLTTKYVQVINSASGNPEYEDVTENGVTKRLPKFETEVVNGQNTYKINREKIKVFDLSDDTKREYLRNYDESSALTYINSLTRKQKRTILKNQGMGNAFTRLFATNSVWKKFKMSESFLNSRREQFIQGEAIKEYEELVDLEKDAKNSTKLFDRIKNSAPIQQVLYSLGKLMGRDQDSDANKARKANVFNDLQNASYEEFLYQSAKIGKDEIKQKRIDKGDSRAETVKRNNKNQPVSNDFMYKDQDNDLEL